jgi:ribonuclease I
MHSDDLYPHGLWPAYAKITAYPNNCPTLMDSTTKKLTPRQKHEYEKHGSCSHLTIDAYFQQEAIVMKKNNILTLRDLLQRSAGNMILQHKLLAYSGNKKIAILTSKECQLMEITTCFEKKADYTVGDQIDCPAYIMNGSRNSAMKFNCNQIFLDKSNSICSVISKELLKAMKADK